MENRVIIDPAFEILIVLSLRRTLVLQQFYSAELRLKA